VQKKAKGAKDGGGLEGRQDLMPGKGKGLGIGKNLKKGKSEVKSQY